MSGASTGFGREVSLELARRGWTVYAGMRTPPEPAAFAADLVRERVPVDGVRPVSLDLTDPDSIRSAVSYVGEATGRQLDVLWHNAGYTTSGFFEDLADEDCRRLMETNFFGTLDLSRQILPWMRSRGTGRIAVTSSNAANTPHPMFSVYAAAKWALEGWCEALSLELAPFGIDVVVLQPGAHATSFGNNVQPISRAGSPYAPLLAAAHPRLSWIGRHARSVDRATPEMIRALTSERVPFRVRIGSDDVIFAALKSFAPFVVRRRIIGWVTGLDKARPAVTTAPHPSDSDITVPPTTPGGRS